MTPSIVTGTHPGQNGIAFSTGNEFKTLRSSTRQGSRTMAATLRPRLEKPRSERVTVTVPPPPAITRDRD
jgi:hypothetical protein